MAGGPLEGLRVIDVGTRIGAPFCAGLLGEWGAEVVKVEQPSGGDFMRSIGPFVPGDDDGPAAGYSLFWAVEGRGRKSATCDLRRPEGQDLFRRLAATADVVCENFRPGTLEGWGIGPDALDPRLVTVRISAFGQDGPYALRPGLDRLGVAYGGLLHLTGEADRPPVRPGVTVADYLTGVFAAEAALAALYRRDARGTGVGAVIDASLYGSVLRILEWTIPAYQRLGTVRHREGNRLSNSAPLDNYLAADGRYVCVVAGSDANFSRLCRAMGRLDLLDAPRFATLAARASHGDEINAVVAEWVGSQSASKVEAACVAHDVPVATAYSAREIATDEHFAARRDLVEIDDPVAGPVLQQAPYPRLVGEPRPVPSGAPRLGADNEDVWCTMVGLSPDELAELRAKKIV
ncbi:MAG TPA: CaiB/BaiF CoA-transferase family protein [Acidimicrobiales bacterium]|nr:CaiB/BaiF CoA-transferase family protein [Acidimicrobiales bacterium]